MSAVLALIGAMYALFCVLVLPWHHVMSPLMCVVAVVYSIWSIFLSRADS